VYTTTTTTTTIDIALEPAAVIQNPSSPFSAKKLFQKQYGENLRVEIFTFMSGQTFNIQSPPNAHSRCLFSSIFVIKKFGKFFPKKISKSSQV